MKTIFIDDEVVVIDPSTDSPTAPDSDSPPSGDAESADAASNQKGRSAWTRVATFAVALAGIIGAALLVGKWSRDFELVPLGEELPFSCSLD